MNVEITKEEVEDLNEFMNNAASDDIHGSIDLIIKLRRLFNIKKEWWE
jgi:hypothetical protein